MDAAEPTPGWEVESVVQILSGLARDQQHLLEAMATQFTQSWPEAVRVQRSGMFNRGAVTAVVLRLPDRHFTLERRDGVVYPSVALASGGVALAHDELPLGEWIEQLAHSLTQQAERSESARHALEGLIS